MLLAEPLNGLLLPPAAFETPRRFSESRASARGEWTLEEFRAWYAERARRNPHRVEEVALDALQGWHRDGATGDLVHDSGRFYSIRGVAVETDHRESPGWSQPIIVQPEIGILGILVKRFGGVLHCLMQAKMEPGNINGLQLSPTVQATRSNYQRVHGGNTVPYLEHFVAPRRGRVLADALQSEQGAWFLDKRNRNMIVETDADVVVGNDFCWLTIGQLQELLHEDNLLNMDARTVLSTVPFAAPVDRPSLMWEDSFRGALLRSLGDQATPLHETTELLSWFTEVKAAYRLQRRLVPLDSLAGWHCDGTTVSHEDGRFFTVLGVDVHASGREVSRWSQPLMKPTGQGLLVFLVKVINGALHVLVQARTEAGTHDVAEMAPTVHCNPENFRGTGRAPRFLDVVRALRPDQIRHDVVHSEEGGRLHHAENRYVIAEVDHDFPIDVPDDFAWMTARQVTDLIQYGNHFNVEARSLLACLHTLW